MRPIVSTCNFKSPKQEAEGKEYLDEMLRLQESANRLIRYQSAEHDWLVLSISTARELF
jgi:hypothetical protein